jgi:hypothetical protein
LTERQGREGSSMGTSTPWRRRRTGRAAFRAIEREVRAALCAGRTLIAIYDEKQSQLGMSYAQFARYAQPFREALMAGHAPAVTPRKIIESTPAVMSEQKQLELTRTDGPLKGRPEEAVPTLDMDGFAAKALKNEDLF